jgi:hypothetical protein
MAKNKTPAQFWKESKEKTIAEPNGKKLKPWEVVYKTIERWSFSDVVSDTVKLIPKNAQIKKEIANAARAVENKTHEQVNASSQAEFLIKVAIGEQVSDDGKKFERTAKLNNGERSPITKIAEKQRTPTKEFLTKPEPIEKIGSISKKVKSNKKVLTGHTGAAYFNAESVKQESKHQVVSNNGSSRGGIHAAQLKAQRESSHHLSFSRRLSIAMDKFQEDGTGILEAFNSEGFHENSNWHGFYIKDAGDALAVAIKARHNYKKRQTNEKHIREPYKDTASMSEDYSEIGSRSETDDDKYKEFIAKTCKDDPFMDFIKKNNIRINSQEFGDKLKSLDNKLGNGRV